MEDLGFGIQLGFDCVALSFVSSPEDVLRVRECMHDIGAVRPIISKLERAACLDRLGAVMDVSDAVMVARGDLGVEVDIKRVPVLQKQIIAEANLHGIPVITATQMLESMTVGLLPTRAEAADVANAVFDGTDALMLSGETSVGRYPVQSVEMMANIIEEAESFHLGDENMRWANQRLRGKGVGEAICHTAVVAAHDLGLKAIIVVTRSGQTALDVAKFRPPAVVHAFAFDPVVHNFLALTRGVSPHLCTYMTDFEPLMDMIDKIMIDDKIAEPGEAVAMVLGVPVGEHAGSNTLTIHNVGEKFSTGYTCSPLEGSL
jgi:pyruvate kinase